MDNETAMNNGNAEEDKLVSYFTRSQVNCCYKIHII